MTIKQYNLYLENARLKAEIIVDATDVVDAIKVSTDKGYQISDIRRIEEMESHGEI